MTRYDLRPLNTQLARAGNAPLDLLIRFTSRQSISPGAPFDVFLANSITHNTLHLEFDGGWFPQAAFAFLRRPGALPFLEELEFSGRPTSDLPL
jgi:hypothetical protein